MSEYNMKSGQEILVIPSNTPYGFIELKTKEIKYTLIRIVPEKN